jgi:hypothetical protein
MPRNKFSKIPAQRSPRAPIKMSLKHHYLSVNESIPIEHITLHRESQMGIPHITSILLEYYVQAIKIMANIDQQERT